MEKKAFPNYEKVSDYAFVTLEFLAEHAFIDRFAIDNPFQVTDTVLGKNKLSTNAQGMAMDDAIRWLKVRVTDNDGDRIFIIRHFNTKIEMI